MNATIAPNVPNLDEATLTRVVRALFSSSTAEVKSWQVYPITEGRASSAGVYRIAGVAQLENSTCLWSLMLKEIHTASVSAHAANNANNDPTSSWYWKREMLLYQSGLFDSLPDGFAAPCCYQIDEEPNGCRIWMEDVREEVGTVWPIAHYRHVAQHFGRFNGLFLSGRPIPRWTWLLTDFLAYRVQRSEWPEFAKHYPMVRDTSPLVQLGWSDDLFAEFERIWQEREQFLQALARLPQTPVHNDAGRKNLVARRRGGEFETVALDWGQSAIGAIGEDLACLVSQPVYWLHGVSPGELRELDAIAFDAYVQGLHDVGWRGNPALARLGYTISIVLRSGYGIFIFEWSARNEQTRHFIESAIGRPIEEVAEAMRGLRGYLVACAGEARQLLGALRLERLH